MEDKVKSIVRFLTPHLFANAFRKLYQLAFFSTAVQNTLTESNFGGESVYFGLRFQRNRSYHQSNEDMETHRKVLGQKNRKLTDQISSAPGKQRKDRQHSQAVR